MKKATAKSLAKTAVLDASDNPDDQDEARKRRVKMDFASWRKQTKAGKTTHQEEVGISSAAAMKKAREEALLRKKEQDAVKKEKEALKKEEVQLERALDTFEKGEKERVVKGMKKDTKGFKSRYGKRWKDVMYATATKKAKEAGDTSKSDKRYAYESKEIGEAKVDAGKSADEKATARNQRNNPKKGDKGFRKFATSAFIRRKEGQSLAWGKDSAASELRRKAHAAKRGVSEAKVDTGDDVKKETDRNKRRFGKDAAPRGSGGVEYAQTLVRRREHRAKRGVKEETIDEKFATQYKDKGKLSKTDAPGSRHDHTHDVDPRMADHVPTKKVRKSSKAETRANVLKFDMKKEETIHELNRYEKETGKSSGPAGSYRGGVNTPRKGTPTKKGGSSDKIIHFAKSLVRGAEGRPTGQTRKSYDARGKEQERKEKPAQTVTKRREARKRAIAFQQDTSGT